MHAQLPAVSAASARLPFSGKGKAGNRGRRQAEIYKSLATSAGTACTVPLVMQAWREAVCVLEVGAVGVGSQNLARV